MSGTLKQVNQVQLASISEANMYTYRPTRAHAILSRFIFLFLPVNHWLSMCGCKIYASELQNHTGFEIIFFFYRVKSQWIIHEWKLFFPARACPNPSYPATHMFDTSISHSFKCCLPNQTFEHHVVFIFVKGFFKSTQEKFTQWTAVQSSKFSTYKERAKKIWFQLTAREMRWSQAANLFSFQNVYTCELQLELWPTYFYGCVVYILVKGAEVSASWKFGLWLISFRSHGGIISCKLWVFLFCQDEII